MAEQDPRIQPTLGMRLKAFRGQHKLSVQNLADRIGVPGYTLRRWEVGSSRPSPDAAVRLTELGIGEIRDDETNRASRSRGSTAAVRGQAFSLDRLPGASLPPWVANGPEDQNGFQKRLIELQLAPSQPVPLHQFSLISEYEPGKRTSQNLLESPKPTASSWNSNYGSHGWHRYVGRFPPHVIRALLNHFGANAESVVCDPFSGSGTTAVECRLLGIPFIGIEIGALSHLMATVKAKFDPDAQKLLDLSTNYRTFIQERTSTFTIRHSSGYTIDEVLSRSGNTVPSFSNIEKWFTPQAFLGVSLTVEFAREQPRDLRDALLVALSAKMRSIGNIDVDVVRAEYSRKPRENVDVARLVTNQLSKMAENIRAMVSTHPHMGASETINLIEGSALSVEIPANSIDYIVTSPPYGVEALSYLRTHLLSYRALASELDHDPYETRHQTIGSEYLDESAVQHTLNVSEHSGTFRAFFDDDIPDADKKTRQRRAAMMTFFEDMHSLGQQMASWLKDGGKIAFIIGNKRLGDRVIPTDEIIRESFASCGLQIYESINHKLKTNNSNSQVPWQERIIQEEAILLFERVARK